MKDQELSLRLGCCLLVLVVFAVDGLGNAAAGEEEMMREKAIRHLRKVCVDRKEFYGKSQHLRIEGEEFDPAVAALAWSIGGELRGITFEKRHFPF